MFALQVFHAHRAATSLAIIVAMCAGCTNQRGGSHTLPGENQAPLAVIEEPRDGTASSPTFRVTGWAGDDRGIRAVRVFLDGELVALASFAWDRPDVTKVYPHLKHGTNRLGYEATVDAALPGPHVVRVEAVDSDGLTTDCGTRRVIVAAR